ncbi:MAG: radical SAM protein [Dongiaceae bacterium]
MSISRTLYQIYDVLRLMPNGGPSCCNIAVTNVCNATCDFCNYAKDKTFVTDHKWLDFDRACRALDILHGRGIRYLTFSGGEPLLHPRMADLVGEATRRGMRAAVVTNGSPLTERNIEALAAKGLRTLFISIDAAEAEKHEANRGLPRVCDKITEANELLRARGIKTIASVTINRLIDDFEDLFAFLMKLGFETVTFTYPKRTLGSSSLVFSETSKLIDFSDGELTAKLSQLKDLKSRFAILNPAESLAEMIRFVKKDKQQFPCFGGFKYFAMDVNFDVYRCDFWSTKMCTIEEFATAPFVRDGCTKCMSVCYRDSSVFFNFPVAIGDAMRLVGRGRLGAALGTMFSSSARRSLRSLLSEWRTLKKLARTEAS